MTNKMSKRNRKQEEVGMDPASQGRDLYHQKNYEGAVKAFTEASVAISYCFTRFEERTALMIKSHCLLHVLESCVRFRYHQHRFIFDLK